MYPICLLALLPTAQCIDAPAFKEAEAYQTRCIMRFLSLKNKHELFRAGHELHLIPSGYNFSSVCLWHGVLCVKKVIKRLLWTEAVEHDDPRDVQHVQFDLDWVPSTVCELDLSEHTYCSTLKTKRLPRALVKLNLRGCLIKSQLSVGNFPSRLREARLGSNRFWGTLLLLRIPSRLQILDISAHKFDAIVVDNNALPQKLKYVALSPLQTNQKVDIKILNGKKLDPRVQLYDDPGRPVYSA